MSTDAAVERVKNELGRAFEMARADLERIEILAAPRSQRSVNPFRATSRGSNTCNV